MSFAVPCPPLPAWVTVQWTPTGSAAVVECSRCAGATALYTTVLRRDPDALGAAVEQHRGCGLP